MPFTEHATEYIRSCNESKESEKQCLALSDDLWQAILNNDASYEGEFFYAVRTTGIFCRPSCKSRPPNKENVLLFRTAHHAISALYRPCKRCNPTGHSQPNNEWITGVAEYIDQHYKDNLTLNKLAGLSHNSPYHLHRTFKRILGVTPVEYIRQRRLEQAMLRLSSSDESVSGIGESVGIANPSHFIALFKNKTGITPLEYRKRTIIEQ